VKLNIRPVLYSNRFLEGEDIANNFLFNADRYVSTFKFLIALKMDY